MSKTINQFSPGVLSMLPLFYVGWSDSVLSPSEMKLIQKKIDKVDFLSKEDKEYLIHWSNPKNIPSDEVFRSWVKALKEHSVDMDLIGKKSIAKIGAEIAQSSIQYKQDQIWKSPKTIEALEEIESALGLKNQASLKILKKSLGSEEEVEGENSFDPESLRKILDGKRIDAKDRMRKLLRDPAFAYRDIRDKDEYRLDILWKLKLLAEQGVGGYAFPKEYGGGGLSGDHIAVFETLAYHDLSLTIKFGVQFGLFGGAVYMLGTEKHHKLYVEPLAKAELLGCFAMTETGHGSNVRGLETTATYDHESKSIVIQSPNLDAGKEYIGNAMHSSMAAVFAQLIVDGKSHGVHAVLVPIRDAEGNVLPGVTVKDCGYKMGLNGVDNGRLWFDRVTVPVDNLLNKYGDIDATGNYVSSIENPNKRFFTMLGALVAGRVCVGLAGLSATKSALAIAVRYSLKRRQFDAGDGGPEQLLMDYPTHQRRLLPRVAKTYAYSFALSQLGED